MGERSPLMPVATSQQVTCCLGREVLRQVRETSTSVAPPARSTPQAVWTPALRVPVRGVISPSPLMGEQSTLQDQSTVLQSRVMGGRSRFLLKTILVLVAPFVLGRMVWVMGLRSPSPAMRADLPPQPEK